MSRKKARKLQSNPQSPRTPTPLPTTYKQLIMKCYDFFNPTGIKPASAYCRRKWGALPDENIRWKVQMNRKRRVRQSPIDHFIYHNTERKIALVDGKSKVGWTPFVYHYHYRSFVLALLCHIRFQRDLAKLSPSQLCFWPSLNSFFLSAFGGYSILS